MKEMQEEFGASGARGITLIELMVAMVILVIIFGLVTFLYTRAAKIRKIVVVHNEMQQVLSRMTDTLTYGERNSWGLIDATDIATDITHSETHICVARRQADNNIMTARIVDPDTTNETTLTIDWGGGQISLDPDKRIILLTDSNYQSRFEYYNSGGYRLDTPLSAVPTAPNYAGNVTFVKITLWARSTDPAFRNADPLPFMTGVRLKNKPSL